MSTFTPPVDNIVPPVYVGPGAERGLDLPSHYADTTPEMQKLMAHYEQRPRGRNVFLLTDGTVTEVQPATWEEVSKVYWGASANPVTADEIVVLTAAGYGAYIT